MFLLEHGSAAQTDALNVAGIAGNYDEFAVYDMALPEASVDAHWSDSQSATVCPATPTSAYAQSVLADSPSVYFRLDDAHRSEERRVGIESWYHCSANLRNDTYDPQRTSVAAQSVV